MFVRSFVLLPHVPVSVALSPVSVTAVSSSITQRLLLYMCSLWTVGCCYCCRQLPLHLRIDCCVAVCRV